MHVVCRHEAPLASWNEHFSHSIIYSFMTRGNSDYIVTRLIKAANSKLIL